MRPTAHAGSVPALRRPALCLVAAGSLASCTSTSGGALAAIPTLGHGAASGTALAPAIAVPSPGAVTYEVEGGLPALADHAVVYRAGTTVDVPQVTRVATALGMSAPVRADASGWTVTDGDKRLQVQRVGGLPWAFSSSVDGSVSSGCAVAVPGSPGGGTVPSSSPAPTCPPTTTVPGLPDEHGAETRARDVVVQAGLDVSGATVRASHSSSGWTVTFDAVLGGRTVLGGTTSVSVGSQGSITAASGHLAAPAPVGSYPLVGVSSALDRLRQGWDWIVYSGPVPMAALGAPGSTAPAPAPAPAVPGATEPQSTAPVPTQPPTIVKVSGVRLALAWAWPMATPNDDAWLVPVYVFELGPGSPYPFLSGGVPILAVADRYVTTPTTTTTTAGSAVPGGRPSNP